MYKILNLHILDDTQSPKIGLEKHSYFWKKKKAIEY